MAVIISRGAEEGGTSFSVEGHFTITAEPLLVQVLVTDAVWGDLITQLAGSSISALIVGEEGVNSKIYLKDQDGREPVAMYEFGQPYPFSNVQRISTKKNIITTKSESPAAKRKSPGWRWSGNLHHE